MSQEATQGSTRISQEGEEERGEMWAGAFIAVSTEIEEAGKTFRIG
jgi:hypothetical protein